MDVNDQLLKASEEGKLELVKDLIENKGPFSKLSRCCNQMAKRRKYSKYK